MSRLRHFLPWVGGWVASFAFILLVCAVFHNSATPVEWNDAIQMYTRLSGHSIRWRSEGWGDTRVGKYGLTAGEDVLAESPTPKFILWGDSMVEALQVPDREKTTFVFNRISGGNPMYGISWGRGGRSVADYYFAMPHYQHVVANVRANVVLLSGLDDVTPMKDSGKHARFLCDPLRFDQATEVGPTWAGRVIGPWIRALHLEPVYSLYDGLRRHKFRFAPSTATQALAQPGTVSTDCDLEQAWRYLVSQMQQQSRVGLAFVYCPPDSPVIRDGRVVLETGPVPDVERFRAICEESGAGFIDMTPQFNAFYEQTGRFPRGFFNSPPGSGHLNADGQRMIAEALLEYFRGQAR
ncbi:hypothetical protein [Pseudodesulfovibrio pelocollis]|uniref:hypothetical protein n=1 Tax=Pseudodesulfovibrio pelocollis TaxID=3051432 RepID=UPI00255A90A9|nr:hypothetical protein [Pseudodesulfovibrio sp. SB368]